MPGFFRRDNENNTVDIDSEDENDCFELNFSFTDLIHKAYFQAIKSGLSIKEFWSMSYGEVIEYINCIVDIKTNERKREITDLFTLANLITHNMSIILAGDETSNLKPYEVWDLYPDLFKEELKEHEELQMIKHQQEMLAYIEAHSKKNNDHT